jgi:nitrogen fixation protein FixH
MEQNTEERRQNRRTAWILATVVLVFFAGVIARRWMMGS